MRDINDINADRRLCAARLAGARSRLVLDHDLNLEQSESILRQILEAVAELVEPLSLLEPASWEIKHVADLIGIETDITVEVDHA